MCIPLQPNLGSGTSGMAVVAVGAALVSVDRAVIVNDDVVDAGFELDRVVTWKSGTSLKELVGKPVRMRVVLRDADFFSLRFRESATP